MEELSEFPLDDILDVQACCSDIEMEDDALQQELRLMEEEEEKAAKNNSAETTINSHKPKINSDKPKLNSDKTIVTANAPPNEKILSDEKCSKNKSEDNIFFTAQVRAQDFGSPVGDNCESSETRIRSGRKINTGHENVDFRRLNKPLHLDKSTSSAIAGREIAYRLEEKKVNLFGHVFRVLGHTLSLEIFDETKKLLKKGGLKTDDGQRKRSPGGTFLYLMKNRGYASKSQTKEIFREEEQLKKKLNKEKTKRQQVKSKYFEKAS